MGGLLFTLATAPDLGAGFQLNATSASGLGAASAGGAAAAEDASTLWSNVAGLSRIQRGQGIAALHMIKPSTEFGNDSSVAAAQQSLGFGLNQQRIEAEFTNHLNYSVALLGVAAANGGLTSAVEIPPVVNLSLFSAVNSQWDVMVDAQWTGWSTIQELTFERSDGALAGTVLSSTPENFEDSWKVSVGANWRLGNGWMVRGGLAYDESPVQATYRTPRLPDNDRTWLTAGGQYRFANGVTLDFGAAYIWVAEGSIGKTGDPPNTALNGLLSGRYSSDTVVLSGQLKMEF